MNGLLASAWRAGRQPGLRRRRQARRNSAPMTAILAQHYPIELAVSAGNPGRTIRVCPGWAGSAWSGDACVAGNTA